MPSNTRRQGPQVHPAHRLSHPIRVLASAIALAALALVAPGSPSLPATRACEELFPPVAAGPACLPDALVTLSAHDPAQSREAVEAIEAAGGCVVHVYAPTALIAAVPATMPVQSIPHFASLFRTSVPDETVTASPFEARLAAAAWNQMLTAPPAGMPPTPEEPTGEPLVGDVREAVRPPGPAGQPPAGAPPSPGFYETSEFMAGDVAIGIILPESNGSIDAQTENWSAERMTSVTTEIQTGLNWWATSGNPNGHLTFYYDTHLQVPTGYEPIKRSSNDDTLWINGTLNTLGVPGSDWYSRTFNYLNAIRTTYATDWAVVIFVVDSLVDSDGKFTDGYFGYTYGFLVVMTYDNDGWGIGNMDKVTAHEIGHDFGAGDEYCSPGYACCSCGGSYGYLGIANTGCEAKCDYTPANGVCDGDDHSPGSNCRSCLTCVSPNCLMNNNYWGLDTPSAQQVGIRDQDSDTILDPVDTTPTVSILTRPPESTLLRGVSYTGSTQDVPCLSPNYNDVTINHITAVQYRVDGGGWLPAQASDGAWDETTEDYLFTTAPLGGGPHTIEIRAVNRVGNASLLQTDTFAIIPAAFLPLVRR